MPIVAHLERGRGSAGRFLRGTPSNTIRGMFGDERRSCRPYGTAGSVVGAIFPGLHPGLSSIRPYGTKVAARAERGMADWCDAVRNHVHYSGAGFSPDIRLSSAIIPEWTFSL